MAIEFRSLSYSFTAPGSAPLSVDFGNTVNSAEVVLKAIKGWHDNDDHEIKNLEFGIYDVEVVDTKVNFTLEFDQQDKNNNRAQGKMTVVVIANVETKG
jgi:hypothetical protein